MNPKVNYCQGMNYVASFIYQLTKSQEESFYLMFGLLENTEFSNIFIDELMKLKAYFHIFERLLYLYLPELANYFKTNTVIVNFFCAPWFITLFTNVYQFNISDEPKIILKIWDLFIMVNLKF